MNAADIEITREIAHVPGQCVALDAHSVLNVLNVLNLQLHELGDLCGLEPAFERHHQFLFALGRALGREELIGARLDG